MPSGEESGTGLLPDPVGSTDSRSPKIDCPLRPS